MRIRLFVPAPFSTISGGYVYDRAMVSGLRAAGHAVSVAELHGNHPLPDDAAHASAASEWASMPTDTRALVDGLCLPAFAPLADALVERGAMALVHHPAALETGRDAVARERLRSIERALLPRLSRVVVTSEDTGRRLAAEFCVDAARVRVVQPGTLAAPRSAGPSIEPGCLVLSVGTLLPRKGHDVLLRALILLPDLPWSLAIVGGARDAAYAGALHAMAHDAGMAERVTFVGELGPDALAEWWERAGVFALATHYEGYGMAIAEAFSRGIPVAVTADAALAARIPPAAGVVAAPGDHAALSTALRRLIFDVPLRRDMADAAWLHGRALPDWEAQARRFAQALET